MRKPRPEGFKPAQVFNSGSVTGQERAKAYREGLGQMAQVHADEVDEAYRRGRAEVWEETRPLRTVRFCFGLLWGVALSALVWSFWP